MGFWGDLAGFATNCVFFVGNVIADVALTVSDYIQKASGIDTDSRIERSSVRNDVMAGLHDLNKQLLHLKRKWFQDGKVEKKDKQFFDELLEEREIKKKELWGLNEADSAEQVLNNRDDVSSTIITPDTPHILQYHIGQAVMKKKCRLCGSPMVLNFKQGVNITSTHSLIWTCSYNYFLPEGQWHPIERYQHSDQKLFINRKIYELECSNADLTTIFRSDQHDIIRRLDTFRNQPIKNGIDNYICPIHGENLILRRNRNAANLGALEKYFFGCPHYNMQDGQGPDSCRYMVTLKSPAQLAAALRSYGVNGII